MNILVCIARTPETTAKIDFTDNMSKYNTDGVQYIMNPYDEWYALVRALEITEQMGGEVTLITVDDSNADSVLRKGLAIGAHKAVRINQTPESAKQAAKAISDYVKANQFDLILCGKETIDYNNGIFGGMLAAYLDIDFIGYVNHMELNNDKLTCHREIEGGVEHVEASLPTVISATKGLANQRIPNMRGIMMAKRKPLEVVEADLASATVSYVKYEKPSGEKTIKMLDPENMAELVRLLHEEAKVI